MNTIIFLNKSWMPIHLCSVENAMSLLYTGKAKAIDKDYVSYSFDEWVEYSKTNGSDYKRKIKTVHCDICVPKVIVATEYNHFPIKKAKYSKHNVYKRDNYTCVYCNNKFSRSSLTVDHVIPRSKGGKTNWENIVTACKKCNSYKDNKSLEEAGMQLLFKPSAPKWIGGTKQGYIDINKIDVFG